MDITYWTVLIPTPLSIWTMEAPSIITTLTPSVIFFFKEELMPRSQSVALQPKLWGIPGIHPPPPPPKKSNEMLSYPHKINWRTLTNVCYGSFTGSKTPETYIFKTVHWQFGDSPSTDSDMRYVSSSTAKYICLPACLPVCLSVCLSVSMSVFLAQRCIALGQWPI